MKRYTPNIDRFGMTVAESKEKTWCYFGFLTKESRNGYVLHHIDEDMIRYDKRRHDMFLVEDCIPMKFEAHTVHHHRGEANCMYGKKLPMKTREKMKFAQMGSKNHFYGKHHTEAVKKIISDAHKGNKYWLGRKHSEESKSKISKSRKNKKAVVQIGDNGLEISRFESVCEASRQTGILRESISKCLRGVSKTAGGYVWRVKEETSDGETCQVFAN